MSVFLAPDPINSTQFLPGSNVPATGALLFCYQNKTSTKMNSYSDPSASTANTNPIVLNSGGNPPQEIWIASTATFVLAPSNDTDPPSSPYRTWNDIPGINNVAALVASSVTGEWVQGSTATFVGVTQFTVAGDQTALYTLGRRIKATVTGGDRFGNITSASLALNTTAVGVTLDSSTLNAGLSSVQYGLLGTPNGSMPWITVTPVGNVMPGFLTPTTSAPLGFGLSSSGPAIFINSTQVFDVTSTEAHVTGVLKATAVVAASTCRAVIPSFSFTSFTAATTALYTTPAGVSRIEVYAKAGGGGSVNGSTSSFNNASMTTVANGGSGTSSEVGGLGGRNGLGSTSLRIPGCAGQTVSTNVSLGGLGGGSGGGIGSDGAGAITSSNNAAPNSGGGAGGGSHNGGGGEGEAFWAFINSPTTSYTYTVGSGGASTASIGVGGSGIVLVKEYYI